MILHRLKIIVLAAAFSAIAVSAFASTQPYITDHQINFGTGNKYLQQTDLAIAGPGPEIAFTRTYNSQSNDVSVLGHGWTAPHTERLIVAADRITLVQQGGRYVHFLNDGNGNYLNQIGARRLITAETDGHRLKEFDGSIRLFDINGRITSFTDRNGNSRSYSYAGDRLETISNNFGAVLTFGYTDSRLTSVTGPQGTFLYGYDTDNNLTSVTAPDNSTITYLYDDPGDPHNLTGVIDQDTRRILTVEYDSNDRVIRSAKQGGAGEVRISYPANFRREVTNSLGITTTYHLEVQQGIVQVGSFAGPGCSSCGSDADMSYLYDERFRVVQKTDAAGTITSYTYDDNGNKETMTEAVGTALEKTTRYIYTAENKVAAITVASIANPGQERVTSMSYDGNANLLTKTEAGYNGTTSISRNTNFSYNSHGQLITVDGPRDDVNDIITMTYYANEAAQGENRGRLHTVTNGLGHVTTYADYNVHGQAETITDANGIMTTRSFTGAGLLLSTTTAGLTTGYSYNAAGALQSISLPGGREISYGYDDAGRVNLVSDNAGNAVSSFYDSEGRNIREEIHDPAGTLVRFTGFEYNDAGRLSKVLLPGEAERSFHYDALGNLVRSFNATGLQTDMTHDLLSRLVLLTEAPGEAEESVTDYDFDPNNNIVSVNDDLQHATLFSYDDFNRKISRTAPDTGTTQYSYDEADNLKSITDALGRSVTFTYDALNRPLTQQYGAAIIDFSYDQSSLGRLSGIDDEHGGRSFLFNSLGQLSRERRTIEGTFYTIDYGYNAATAEPESITYPSGMEIHYNRGADGRIRSVMLDGSIIIDSITHLPFGPLQSATLGTTSLTRYYDQRYNLTALQAGNLQRIYSRDAEGHVLDISNLPVPAPADRIEQYSYDPTNNRLTGRGNISYSYDAVGNITSDGTFSFFYDELNRLRRVERDGTVVGLYGYDSSNRRIIKTTEAFTTHYLYNADSNLIAEAQADGTPIRDYIYLDGELLAIQEYRDNPGIYFCINDHLGTPQQLIDSNGAIVWQAAYLPFGKAQVSLELVVNNIRFPGQYYDAETGLHYNWHRFYDPETGRYISADPIGLAGGMNLYAYVAGNPINWIDPKGLAYSPGGEHGLGWDILKPPSIPTPPPIGGTLFLNNFELSERENGCRYLCWSLTTDIIGGGIPINYQSPTGGSPFSFHGGWGRYGGVTVDAGGMYSGGSWHGPNLSGTAGWSYGLPIGGSWRLICWSLTETDDNGCPCPESPNKSTFGSN